MHILDYIALHKEDCPENTISVIRKALHDIDILMLEKWYSFNEYCYSVRIEDSKDRFMGANGKGITRELALASAYAEFVERLQNGYRYRPYSTRSECVKMHPSDFVREEFSIQEELAERLKCKGILPETTLPYVYTIFNDIKTNKEYVIPEVFLNFTCGTNGMCAGNSHDEALVQGICEVLERYAVREYFSQGHSPRLFKVDEMCSESVKAMIEEYKNIGYQIDILDCTLDGTIPVICALFINKEQTKYSFSFASDPVFDVAISGSSENCIHA
jgi:ribosomal protein S12 methylthiotransferase accessory factor